MKRCILLLLCVMLSGCSFSGKEMETGTKAMELRITLENEAYAAALMQLWNTTYPQFRNALKFNTKTYHFRQQFDSDIEWVKDSDALYKVPFAAKLTIADEYDVPDALHRDELHNYFQPIQAKGQLFVYLDDRLLSLGQDVDQLDSFEQLSEKGKGYYYYQHSAEKLLPVFLSGLEKKDVPMEALFQDSAFTNAIQSFKDWYSEMDITDDISVTDNPLSETYAYGIVDPEQMIHTQEYKQGKLHFAQLPSYKDHKLACMSDVYGFMAKKDANPELAVAFMNMVRSKKGLQVFLDTGQNMAMIDKDDLDDFSIYDARRKEMIIAVNSSQLWDLSIIEEKPSIRMKDIYLNPDLNAIIQNGICANKSAIQIQKQLIANVESWIWKQ